MCGKMSIIEIKLVKMPYYILRKTAKEVELIEKHVMLKETHLSLWAAIILLILLRLKSSNITIPCLQKIKCGGSVRTRDRIRTRNQSPTIGKQSVPIPPGVGIQSSVGILIQFDYQITYFRCREAYIFVSCPFNVN